MDGFIVRRPRSGGDRRLGVDDLQVPDQFLEQKDGAQNAGQAPAKLHRRPQGPMMASAAAAGAAAPVLRRRDVDEALKSIEDEAGPAKGRPRRFRLSRKAVKRLVIAAGVVFLLVGGYVGFKALIAGGRVFDGNLFAALFSEGKPLKTDANGRVNILLFGTSEDSRDHEDAGADLADSIMIASIDPQAKNGFMMSVPRDLWVKYGKACASGYEGKINVAYQCGKGQQNDERQGAEFLQKTIGTHFGIDFQYYAHVNYTALVTMVDAVGGITVEIDSDDPRGILDRNFDWKCRYRCYYVKYPNGPVQLNGEKALALARARNAQGGYGLSGGNFDREQYQQKILVALKDKATSAGTLANPAAVSGILDSLGDNVRTNFDAGEIKTLITLGQELQSNNLKRLSLVDKEDPLVTTGNYGGQSIVRPVAGVYDFSEIKNFIRKQMSGDAAALEDATVDVLNGSGVAGAAQSKADELEAKGYTVGSISNAPNGNYGTFKLYDMTKGKLPRTKAKLEKDLGVTAVSGDTLPAGVVTEADFVIIIGSNGVD